MNWNALSREAKQRLLIYVLLAVIVFGGSIALGILPLRASNRAMRNELAELDDKLFRSSSAIKAQDAAETAFRESRALLTHDFKHHLPPRENTLIWATERMNAVARRLGIEIESLNELQQARPSWAAAPAAGQEEAADRRRFVPYAVQLAFECGYFGLARLIAELENDNPLVSVTGLSINGRRDTPERHTVRLIVQWPFYADEPDRLIQDILGRAQTWQD